MSTDPSHWDAGAYALGALEPADAEAFEAHLIGCDACADEVEALMPVVGMMGRVDADEMVATHNVMPRPRTVRPSTAPPPVEAPRTPPARAAPQRPAPSRRTTSTRPVSGRVELPPLALPDPARPDPLRPEPVRPDSVRLDAVRPDPVRPAPLARPATGARPVASLRPVASPRPAPPPLVSSRPSAARPSSAPGRRRSAMDTVSALHRRVRQAPRHIHLTGSGRGRLAASALILVFVAGLAFVVGAQVSGSTPAAGVDSTAIPFTRGATQLEATDPVTGVHAVLNVAAVPWGSQVQLSLGGVHGPLRCNLVAIGTDATSTMVASWIVYEPGYGIPEEPELLTIQASTAARLSDTSHFEIRQIRPDGRATTLLTLPV